MGRDLQLAQKLRAAGLKVVEVAGWQQRGSETFNPRGFVWHHTAGGRSGNAPSLNVCIYGRADLPGPLCNVFLARDQTVYVVAAGRANHAGTGGWQGLSGNSSVYGLEIENVGTPAEPWSFATLDTAARVASALIADPNMCCMHKEWTSRKIDMHTVSGTEMRSRMSGTSKPAPTPTQPSEEDDMATQLIRCNAPGHPQYDLVVAINGLFRHHVTAVDLNLWLFFSGGEAKLAQLDGPTFDWFMRNTTEAHNVNVAALYSAAASNEVAGLKKYLDALMNAPTGVPTGTFPTAAEIADALADALAARMKD